MNLKPLFDPHAGMPVRVGLIGAGQFGVSLISQGGAIPNFRVAAVCDVKPERGVEAFAASGVPRDAIRVCETRAEAAGAIEAGRWVVVPDGGLLAALPLDIVVEATGDPEVGAANAVAAIDAGKHLVMVTKEADSVIGPLLARRAGAAGRIVTPVDGDQPSLTIGLKAWAELLGLAGRGGREGERVRLRLGSARSDGHVDARQRRGAGIRVAVGVPRPRSGARARRARRVAGGAAAADGARLHRAVRDREPHRPRARPAGPPRRGRAIPRGARHIFAARRRRRPLARSARSTFSTACDAPTS